MKQYICMLLAGILFFSVNSHADEFTDAALQLNEGNFNAKRDAVDAFQIIEDDRTVLILQAMLDGKLLAHESQPELVIEREISDTESEFINAFSQNVIENFNDDDYKKVRTNNRLRRHIRTAIAGLELTSADVDKRLQAANNLIKNNDKALSDIINQAYTNEGNGKVKASLAIALALINADSSDEAVQLQAVEVLGTAVNPEAVAVLNRLSERNEEGEYTAGETVGAAAFDALDDVNRRLSLYKTTENIFFGISLGSVLLLAAVGLAITFGVMGVINMAHGEMIMLGAYTTFAIQQIFPNAIEASLLIAIPAAFLVSGSAGVLIERLVIRHLYGRPLETLLATFGVSLILQQAVRVFRSNNVPVITPDWMSGSFEVNAALSLTFNRFYIIWFSLFVVFFLMLLLKKTQFGLQMRAVTQNRPMANAMGIKSSWVDAMTFGLGSGIAGIAGVALSTITNVGPNLGQAYIIDSFMVVVFGGVGNLFGTVFAAMSLGIVNKFLEPFAGAVLGKIFVLVFIILFIQWRPRGMFALKGRAVED